MEKEPDSPTECPILQILNIKRFIIELRTINVSEDTQIKMLESFHAGRVVSVKGFYFKWNNELTDSIKYTNLKINYASSK
jgi:hypothetical protein